MTVVITDAADAVLKQGAASGNPKIFLLSLARAEIFGVCLDHRPINAITTGSNLMDNRLLLEKLTRSFNLDDLAQFLFQAGTKFKRGKYDYNHYLQTATIVRSLHNQWCELLERKVREAIKCRRVNS